MEKSNENSLPNNSLVPRFTGTMMESNRGNQNMMQKYTNDKLMGASIKVIMKLIQSASQKTQPVKKEMMCSIQQLLDDKMEVNTFFERFSKLFDIQIERTHQCLIIAYIKPLREAFAREGFAFFGFRAPVKPNVQFMTPGSVPQPSTVRFDTPIGVQNVPISQNADRFLRGIITKQQQQQPMQIKLLPQNRAKFPAITAAPTVEAITSNRLSEPIEKPIPLKMAAEPKFVKQRLLQKSPLMKEGIEVLFDAAAMAGINYGEESMAGAEAIGAQKRPIKVTPFLILSNLLARFKKHTHLYIENNALVMISQAVEEHLKNIIDSLNATVELRLLDLSLDDDYQRKDDLKFQLTFLGDVERIQERIFKELQREQLLRIINSRARTDNPEHAKIRARALEIQRAEAATLQHQNANLTALEATGPRKKICPNNNIAERKVLKRTFKRATLRDMIFHLQNSPYYKTSQILFAAYLR